MATFIQDVLNGDCEVGDIYKYIDEYEEKFISSMTRMPKLHEYLGLSSREFDLFIKDHNNLELIICMHEAIKKYNATHNTLDNIKTGKRKR